MDQVNVAAPTPRADLGVGLFVLLLGGVTLYSAATIPPSPLVSQVGPKAVPYVVAAFLAGIGVALCASALRGGWSGTLEEMRDAAPLNLRALGLLLAGLLVQLALIEFLGFILAATAQFVLVCAAFGSRRPLRDLLIGAAVTVLAYLGFSRLLGVNIGAGVLEGFL